MTDGDYECFDNDCTRTFDSLDEMVAVPGRGDRDPRHFCKEHAEKWTRGPPV